MPKLLLIGIIERTCLKTVVREIPGITDCFQLKSDGNERKVSVHLYVTLVAFSDQITAIYKRFEHTRSVGICLWDSKPDDRCRRNILEQHLRDNTYFRCRGGADGNCEGDECCVQSIQY